MFNPIKMTKWWSGILFVILCNISLLAQAGGINGIGSFEQEVPSYWKKGAEPGGATLTWANDHYKTHGKSLKIEKAVTAEAAVWESENMCDIWSPVHNKD
ncbi:MAG: hypothetical protein R6W90_16325, partial [Ignavibacteriaceae bacterium]